MTDLKLHVGCGRAHLDGWINLDTQPLPGVDVVADVTRGLAYGDGTVAAIYAEHFLEHLALPQALAFLTESHRVLASGGWLRLSTPNLDWVFATHYEPRADPARKRDGAIALNRAFHGWRHQFLWNRELLQEALGAHGFAPVRWCAHGESTVPHLHGIERHERYPDAADLPHVLIAEAAKADAQPARRAALAELIERDFVRHLAD